MNNNVNPHICRLTITLSFVFLFQFFNACKTSRIGGTSYQHISISELLKANDTSCINANILDIRFKAKYTDPGGSVQRATCYLRMYTDSLIWVSLRSVNIEGMRMLLTPDSLYLVDRMNKKYHQGSYGYFAEKLLITPNFFFIQDMLLQKMYVFNPEMQQNLNKKLKPCKDSLYYCMRLDAEKPKNGKAPMNVFSPEWVQQDFRYFPHNKKIAETKLKSTLTGDQILIEYSDHGVGDNNQYPDKITIRLSGQHNLSLELDMKKAEFGDTVKTPFKIPENYEPVRF
jgi:hypothetical protein